MPNGTYGGVRGKETKVGQKTFVSQPTRLIGILFTPQKTINDVNFLSHIIPGFSC